MKITNIEITSASYDSVSDLFCALVSMTMNDCLVINGVRATYSDDNPTQNSVQYPDGFHFANEVEQTLVQEQVLSTLARHARQHEKKQLHDAIKKFMSCKKVKNF